MTLPTFADVQAASERVRPFVHRTPIVNSSLLDSWLGHQVFFKLECMQRTGAFKLRGAANVLAWLKEKEQLPERIVANSSGNHAQAIAYAAALFNIPATIYCTRSVSAVKAAATRFYGAELKLFATRTEADRAVQEEAEQPGTLWIPPFNHKHIIAGQGTAALEALEDLKQVDGVFAPCGGGGLLAGTLLATNELCPQAEVIGAEPLAANDAANSLRAGHIVPLDGPATTLADGAATPSVGELTFPLLQQLDGFYEVDEVQIAYWTQWIQHLLKIHLEPTCAMSMAAVVGWLQERPQPSKALVIISGGNIDAAKMQQIWATDYLDQPPIL